MAISINNNLYKFGNLLSEYSNKLGELSIGNISSYNPYWKPNLSNKINRIIYILDKNNSIEAIYELNFVINLAILKRLQYQQKNINPKKEHIELIHSYLIQSLLENFRKFEIINLANFKLIYYTLLESGDLLYKTNCHFDIDGNQLSQPMNSYIRILAVNQF